MTEPFIGEVQIFGFPFAPRNWSFANGASVPLRQFTSLYALYGTQFGGDGVSIFGLPNLASRAACGNGQSPGNSQRSIGQAFGTAAVALTSQQMPAHTHNLDDYQPELETSLVATPTSGSAVGFATLSDMYPFGPQGTPVTMNGNAIGQQGTGNPHANLQPFLGLNYCVSLSGDFPYFD